jgi:hypothetical protein
MLHIFMPLRGETLKGTHLNANQLMMLLQRRAGSDGQIALAAPSA